MATHQQIREASEGMARLPPEIEVCEAVAVASIETHQAWLPVVFGSTDFQRARDLNMASMQQIMRQIGQMRKDTRSADLIRAYARVLFMYDCCQECPQENQQHLNKKEPFRCLIKERCETAATTTFRFTLDEKGNLNESH